MTRTSRRSALLLGASGLLAACARTGSGGGTATPGSTTPRGSATTAPAGGTYTELKPAAAFSTVSEQLVEEAKAEAGALTWYESTPDDQAAKVMAAFRQQYPFVTGARHQVLRASEVATRVATESQAGADTANVVMVDGASMAELTRRNLLTAVDWKAHGVPAALVPDSHLVTTSAAIFVLVSNTNLVTEADAPKAWDDIVDAKWKGKVGTWESPYAFAELVPAWGAEKTEAFMEKFKAQQPRKFTSTFPLTQAVAAGELPVGVAIFQSAQTTIKQGGPLRAAVPDPTSVTLIHAAVTAKAKSPKTAALFCAWLTSQAGATAFETATDKGNPLLPGTNAGKLVQGRKLSGFAPDKATELADWLKKLAR